METMIPAPAAPVPRRLALAVQRVPYPQLVGWVLVLASIGAFGAILRRSRAAP